MKMDRLRVLRAERDISQLDLARQLGWSPARLWRIEHGDREATPGERQALADFFGTTVDAIWPSGRCEEAA